MHDLDVVIGTIENHSEWPPEEMIDMFARLLIDGWLSGEMSPDMARRWGQRLGHWARVEQADRDVKAEGWSVVKQLSGEEE